MASIRKTETRPERELRQALREAGLAGYRKNARWLPGNPDVAYTRWRVAVFVDGMFWHGHPDYFTPGTKGPYWDQKIKGNQDRDIRITSTLRKMGWRVLRFWEMDVLHRPEEAVHSVQAALREAGRPI
jgi:DNA mismatch endonuclease (patch repair protein)